EQLRKITDPIAADWREKYRTLEREYDAYRRSHGSMLSLFSELRSAVEPLAPLPAVYTRPKKKTRVESPCAAVMRTSDGHHGAVQEASEIEGFNAYS
ncbi:hypothetical protein LRR18_18005, partial [Mangrovimonas sp. AS39]|uniref:hypothetical protein n=1 Tax=Mangrovimonas futianensis TaxID=2895523 RepID=UPI001E486EEB